MSNNEVKTDIRCAMALSDPRASLPVTAALHYTADDPYAVRVTFYAAMDDPVEWIFARELLRGTEGWAGFGDVHVQRAGDVMFLVLESPDGRARIEATVKDIEAFLSKTYAIVPPGDESDFLRIESDARTLLCE
jgi:Streptomyces sporulation and cell division protein, SsgA